MAEEERKAREELPAQESPKEAPTPEPTPEAPQEAPAQAPEPPTPPPAPPPPDIPILEETPPQPAETPPTQEEKTWAILAHASILLNLVTGLLGLVAAFVIWVVKRKESKYVAFQSLQAWVYQVAMLVVSVVLWVVASIIISIVSALVVTIPLLCLIIPAALVAQFALIGYGAYGAYACSEGRDFRYVLIGDWVEAYA